MEDTAAGADSREFGESEVRFALDDVRFALDDVGFALDDPDHVGRLVEETLAELAAAVDAV